MDILKALVTGISVGFIFGLVRAPIPAPGVFAGVAGVAGIWVGYVIVEKLRSHM